MLLLLLLLRWVGRLRREGGMHARRGHTQELSGGMKGYFFLFPLFFAFSPLIHPSCVYGSSCNKLRDSALRSYANLLHRVVSQGQVKKMKKIKGRKKARPLKNNRIPSGASL
jgi:hypothetical protein